MNMRQRYNKEVNDVIDLCRQPNKQLFDAVDRKVSNERTEGISTSYTIQ